MIKKYLLLLVASLLFSQPEDCSGDRYISEIFDVDIEYGVQYGENINQTLLGSDYTETLYMDIYTPSNDIIEDRPLIFFMFGGSFIGGSKSSGDIVALCTKYAQRGYVAVAIDYRLSPVLIFSPNEEVAYKAVLKAVHDVKAAIRYFNMMDETSASTYKIDSNRIFVGGVSAGAIAAVNAGYLNTYEEVPSFLLDDYDEVGGIEGLSGNPGYSSEFHGIVNLCGAVGSQDWIVQDDIPVVSMHGDQDDVVPYDDNLVTLFGLNIQIDGSYIIQGWGNGSTKKEAIDQAKRNVLTDILLNGIGKGCKLLPLIIELNAETTYKNYIYGFFSSDYDDFIELENSPKSIKKSKKQTTYGVKLRVNRQSLRQKLITDNILKK